MPLVKFVLLTWRSRMVLAPCVCAACEPGQRGSAVKPPLSGAASLPGQSGRGVVTSEPSEHSR